MKVTIWSDFLCPYCYIGEEELRKAINDLDLADDVHIEYKAYELSPDMPKDRRITVRERLEKRYDLTPEEAQRRVDHVTRQAAKAGLEFNYDTAIASNTRDAHRLMKLAEDKYGSKTAMELNFALFDAYFNKNKVLSDHKVLSEIAVGAGLDADDVKRVLDSDLYNDRVVSDETNAHRGGINSIPYMVIDGTYAIPGALREYDYVRALRYHKELKEGAHCSNGVCHV